MQPTNQYLRCRTFCPSKTIYASLKSSDSKSVIEVFKEETKFNTVTDPKEEQEAKSKMLIKECL